MHIYKEKEIKKENFLIVSFFTQNYKEKADRLVESLDNLNLNYKVYKIPTIHYSKSSKGSDDTNYSMPKLILEMINKFNIPILFVDCDIIFKQKPDLFFDFRKKKIDFAIYNWLEDTDNDGYLPVKLKVNIENKEVEKIFYINAVNVKLLNNPDMQKQLFSSGAVAYFSNSKQSINILKEWLENIKKYPRKPDDQLLDYTFNYSNIKNELKVEWLDKSYCRVYWWIFTKPVIDHPEQVEHRKNDSFSIIDGKERFKIECTIERNASKIPKDNIIDVEQKKIFKVKNGKIYFIKKFKSNIYLKTK